MKHGITGYSTYKCRCDVCRAANAAVAKRYYERNKEACLERTRVWARAKRKKAAEERAAHYEANKDAIDEANRAREERRRIHQEERRLLNNARRRQRRKENQEQEAEYSRRYYAENMEHQKEVQRRYREENKEALEARRREYREMHKDAHLERKRAMNSATKERAKRGGGKYTAAEDRVLMSSDDLSIAEVAFMLGRTWYSVEARRRKLRKLAQQGETA